MSPRERTTSLSEQVLRRDANTEEEDPFSELPPNLYLPSGSTMFNLAMSDKIDGGWPCGRINNLTGDSDTGKTVMGLSCLAEACKLEEFSDHQLIYADIEEAIDPGMLRMFGKRLMSRIQLLSSASINSDMKAPETVQELHYQLIDLIESGKPFIYIPDSLDFLPSKDDLEKTKEDKSAWKKGKDTGGTYQMSKPKYVKRMLGEVKAELRGSNSMLLLVRQTIDNVGSMFTPKAATGGNAIKFGSSIEAWASQMELDKSSSGIIIGRKNKCKIMKNRITGKKREVSLWLYDNLGIDDLKSCVEFLIETKKITKVGGWITWDEKKMNMRDFLKFLETGGMVEEIRARVQAAWNEIEESLRLDRGPRYE